MLPIIRRVGRREGGGAGLREEEEGESNGQPRTFVQTTSFLRDAFIDSEI